MKNSHQPHHDVYLGISERPTSTPPWDLWLKQPLHHGPCPPFDPSNRITRMFPSPPWHQFFFLAPSLASGKKGTAKKDLSQKPPLLTTAPQTKPQTSPRRISRPSLDFLSFSPLSVCSLLRFLSSQWLLLKFRSPSPRSSRDSLSTLVSPSLVPSAAPSPTVA